MRYEMTKDLETGNALIDSEHRQLFKAEFNCKAPAPSVLLTGPIFTRPCPHGCIRRAHHSLYTRADFCNIIVREESLSLPGRKGGGSGAGRRPLRSCALFP